MSVEPPQAPVPPPTAAHAPTAPAPVPLRCPRCGAHVAPEQDWCLECGAPARTRLAPTPNWRLPLYALAAVVLAAGVALAIAFATLTKDDGTVATGTVTSAPVNPAETATAAGTTSVPTAPAATVTEPAAGSIAAPASSATP